MRLDIDVDNPVDGVLAQTEKRLQDLRPGLASTVAAFHNREAQMFATAGGGTWQPLQPDTAARKGSPRILVDDGGLLRDLTSGTSRYSVVRYEGDSVFVGTKNPVAHLLRDGARGTARRNPVPPTTATERAAMLDPLLAYIVHGATS